MEFDFIIVGAGTAGCVLASRLSENKRLNILLLEAGDEIKSDITHTVPLAVGKFLNQINNIWLDKATPSLPNFYKSIDWVSGKCIGGSSAVNGMIYVRGHPAKYDEWSSQDCPEWNYEKCLPYFKRLENCGFSDSLKRDTGGPINVELAETDEISEQFINACLSTGIPRVHDYNSEIPDGVSYLQLSSKKGRRVSAGKAYIDPIRDRKNLTIIKNATVTRIEFDKTRACAVEFLQNQTLIKAKTRKEIILSAGSVRSPKILELSGIGNPEILQNFNIPIVLAQNLIGENLQDHLMARICYETNSSYTLNNILDHKILMLKEFLKYITFGKGILATTTLKSTAYIRSNNLETIPNLRLQISLMSAAGRIPGTVNGKFNLKALRSDLDPGSAFHIGVYGLYPNSKGHTHINSPNFMDNSLVIPNYLSTKSDQKVIIEGLNHIRNIANQPSFKNIIKKEIRPGIDFKNEDELLNYAIEFGHTCWHPIGTCKMGNRNNSVVDQYCQVYGLTGLRVIDASVFPIQISSNTNTPVIMLAEKMSDHILKSLP